jgi:replicative DNA helicase
MLDRPCYELEFSDGTVLVADAQHQWLTEDAGIRTTEEIAATRAATHSVANTEPLHLAEAQLPIPAYPLGVCLGDTTDLDPEIVWQIEEDGCEALPVVENRRIPQVYLRASRAQRRALLAGLLDTSGTVTADGRVTFRAADRELAEDVRELVVSLGYRCETSAESAVTFDTDDSVFRVEHKRLLHKEYRRPANLARTIVAVRPVQSVPVRCVEVDNDAHLYLAGRTMVPTHNSTLGLDFVRSCSVKHSMTSVIFSLEMSKTEIVMRMLSAEAKIRLSDMRGGRMTDDDWTRLARRMSEISEAPLFVDDSPNMTMMEIRAKARRIKQRHDLKLIVVDYLQLMTSGKRVESRQQEVSEFSRQLKLLAKELEVPVIAISQLNRGPEQRTDKRPMLSDLRESGSLEQDADMVILIHRPDAWERDDPRAGEADLILGKHRAGPLATITVAHQLHYSRFTDLAQQ